MKLSAYIVRLDSGFSPNPFGRSCTLACCKPTIRRKAQAGDTIIGTGSARSSVAGKLVYAMRVARVLPFQQYWEQYASKRPSAETEISRRGDNIWHQDTSGKWRGVRGALHDEKHRERDVRGVNALIGTEFYYFGKDAVEMAKRFRGIMATTQGHKNTFDERLINAFWDWLREHCGSKRGRIGLPSEFTAAGCCSQNVDKDDDDEEETLAAC